MEGLRKELMGYKWLERCVELDAQKALVLDTELRVVCAASSEPVHGHGMHGSQGRAHPSAISTTTCTSITHSCCLHTQRNTGDVSLALTSLHVHRKLRVSRCSRYRHANIR
jgi:hypothetical protein